LTDPADQRMAFHKDHRDRLRQTTFFVPQVL
jgi:hypothetical protein